MNYLIIYQEVPENIKVYYVERVTEDEVRNLNACHGKYINSDEWPESEWLSNWLLTARELKLPHSGYFEYVNIITTGVIL